MKHLIIFLVAVFINTAYAQFGTQVGEYNGVKAYSNGSVSYVSKDYNSYSGTNTGLKWQCVEYANRYYAQIYNMNIRVAGHNANQYYSNASVRGLQVHANGGNVPPKVGDILCSSGGQYGHIAIVREVSANSVKVIQQNWNNNSNDNAMTLSYNSSTNTVGAFSSSYPVQGWLSRTSSSGGFIKVKTGLSVPTTVVKGVQFNVEFSLKETNNLPITLQGFAVSVHKPDGSFLFDIHLSNNVSFSPGEEKFYNFSAMVYNVSTTPPGTYTVRAKGQMNNAWFDIQTLSGAANPKLFTLIDPPITSVETENLAEFALQQNFPNPFNPLTAITFSLGSPSKVKLNIINSLGEVVTELVNGVLSAGSHTAVWDAASSPTGIYLVVLYAESAEGTKMRLARKMAFLK